MDIFAITHIGLKRDRNEDRYLVKEFSDGSTLLAVADGMGGEAAGDYAAEVMINGLADIKGESGNPERQIPDQVREADLILRNEADTNPDLQGMGTTVTVAHIKDGTARWVHAGDSRLYLLRDQDLIQITKDQNVAQFLVDEGEITVEEARTHSLRNLLDQCVGCGDCQTETGHFKINKGDLILLSSDGLHGSLSSETIIAIMDKETETEDKVKSLLQAALNAGGEDNITIIVGSV